MSGHKITFPSENAQGDGQGVTFDDGKASKQGLIVIHEWWGLNASIQKEAQQIGKEGHFITLVPDMYRGKLATDFEEAGHLMGSLDWNGAMADIAGAARYLKSLGCIAVGVTGFCMGGALSFAAAARVPDLISAAAAFYGIPKPDVDLTQIRIPVQAHFGEQDHVRGFSSPDDYRPLKEKLLAAGVPLELHEYPTGHAFANSDAPGYNKEAATLAIGRLCQFMQKHLK